jgi:hypothetical protein
VGKQNEPYILNLVKALPIVDFIKFNFGKESSVIVYDTITPDNLDWSTIVRLQGLKKKIGTYEDVIEKLNIPHMYIGEPIHYKYCYEYYVKFNTNKKLSQNHLTDEEIIKPVDNIKLFAKLLL